MIVLSIGDEEEEDGVVDGIETCQGLFVEKRREQDINIFILNIVRETYNRVK